MTEVRRSDPAARRQAVIFLVVTTALGAALILGMERYGEPLREWVLSDPNQMARRLGWLFALFAIAASAPLIAFALYLWKLGARVITSRQYPPPGQRVLHDTPIVSGPAAVTRGRALKVFAAVLVGFCFLFWVLLWRLAAFARG